MAAVGFCPPWVPSWVSAPAPGCPELLAAIEVDWRPAGAGEWLGCNAGSSLDDVLRDCGAIEVRATGTEDGRAAAAVPVGNGWVIQVRACLTDGVVEQAGEFGAVAIGPRCRISSMSWTRPASIGPGWVVGRSRAADVIGQWAASGAMPARVTTAFLAPAP